MTYYRRHNSLQGWIVAGFGFGLGLLLFGVVFGVLVLAATLIWHGTSGWKTGHRRFARGTVILLGVLLVLVGIVALLTP